MQLNEFVHFEEIFDFFRCDPCEIFVLQLNNHTDHVTKNSSMKKSKIKNYLIFDPRLPGSLPIECNTCYIEQYLIIHFPI